MQRSIALVVAFYFSMAQLAILPAAFESRGTGPAEASTPYSVAHLVQWLEGRGAEAERSTAATAPDTPVGVVGAATAEQVAAAAAQALAEWQAAHPDANLSGITVGIADLAGFALGETTATSVLVDVDAAGHGWDVAYPASEAGSHMDLLTVVRHEVGHALGHAHGDGLMAATLSPGETHAVPVAEPTSTNSASASTEASTTEPMDTSTSTSTSISMTNTSTTDTSTTSATEAPTTSSTTGWTVDGDSATYNATGALDHTLTSDGATLSVVDATGRADVVDLTGIASVTVLGSDGGDRLTLDLAADASVAVTVHLGAGADELVGPATDQRWVIDGAGAGTVAGVAFFGVEDVTGAAGNEDTFVIEAAGSIAGVVAGGDGGFDVIEISGGDFTQVDFVATGPQSGTITRDGDMLTYTGMEPVTSDVSAPVQTVTLSGADDVVEIQDATPGDGTFEIVVISDTAESVTLVNASDITDLVIDLGDGIDLLRFVAIDSLFTGTITVIGGAGEDTLEVPPAVAARWDVTSVNAGTYQGVDASGEDVGPSVSFSAVEHLIGAANEADAVDFSSGAGLTGTFVDGAGELTVALAGFVKVTGDYDLLQGAYTAQVVPDGGETAVADTSASVLKFGDSTGTGFTGFIGTDPLDTPVGLQGVLSSFGLAIVTTATQGYHVFSGTLDASFVGGDILSIPLTTMTISINDAGSDGTFLDLSGATITAGPETLAFSSTIVQASVTTTLSIDAFVHVSGTFTFARGGQYRVDVATGLPADLIGVAADLASAIEELPRIGVDSGIDLVNDIHISNDFTTIHNLPVAVMTISVQDASIFVGYSPNWTDTGNGNIELAELGDDAIGFFANDIDFAFAKLSPRPTEYRALNKKLPGFTAMKLSIGSIEFVGIDEIEISASQLLLEVNNGSTWPGDLGPPVVDFAASFPGDPTDDDLDGNPNVPVGLQVGDLYLDFDGNQRFGISSPQVVLTLGDFVHIAGGFAFTKGPTEKIDIGTGLPAIVAEGLDALPADLKSAFDTAVAALGTSATEPTTDAGGATIKSDFSMIWNVEVSTLQFGVSDVNVFVGYLGADGWTDADGDNVIDVGELGDAVGLYASDIDLGFVSMTPTLGSLPGFEGMLPKFFALKATSENLALVGIPEITITALESVLKINGGTPWKGTPFTPRVDWAASFPDDPDASGPATSGYLIETGGDAIVIDYGGSLLTEVSSGTVILTISDFVHISGGFSYREGPAEVVEIATGLPAGLSEAALDLLGADSPFGPVADAIKALVGAEPTDDSITIKDDFSTIWNVPVGTMQVGFSDVNVFIGYNPGWVDTDGDGRMDMAEPGSGLAGAWVEVTDDTDGDGHQDVDEPGSGENGTWVLADDDVDGDGKQDMAEPGSGLAGAWIAATDDRDGDGRQDVDELGSDAIGLYAFDIDVGIVFMTPSVTGAAIDAYLPSFYALRASAGNLSIVGVPDVTVSAADVLIEVNNGDPWPGGLGPPVVNFDATFGDLAEEEGVDDDGDGLTGEPGGYQVDTGGDPIYIDYNGNQRIGASSPEIILTLGDFVHLTGGFAFEMGPTEKVDIATGLPSDLTTAVGDLPFDASEFLAAFDLLDESDTDPADGSMAISSDYAYLYNLEVATLQFGISDVNVFIGYGLDWTDHDGDHRIDRAEADASDDRDGDTNLDIDEFGDSAVGLYAFDVDLGFALMTPTLQSLPGFDQLFPNFYALKASADELSLIGIDEFTLSGRGVRVEVNGGGNWGGTPWGGVIDWQSSFDGDTDGDGSPDGPVGFRVDTGRTPVYLDYEGQAIIGGGADLVVIGLSEFVHLRGSIYFEKGTVLTVPLVDGLLSTEVVNGLLSELGMALGTDALAALNPASGEKELEFLNIGGQDLYAFVGVGGPHWTTAISGDLTSDLLFECDPDAGGCTTECHSTGDLTDGHAPAEDAPTGTCTLVLNDSAIGLAVSNLDFALALGTPTNMLDPTRYITLYASVDTAGLVGLDDLAGSEGIIATVRGVEFELNLSTPTLNGVPLLPVIDWLDYADQTTDGTGCTAAMIAGTTALGTNCTPFGVKTGALVGNTPVVINFFYDSLMVRAAVEMLELNILGVLVVRGSVAFVLGPTADVTLTDTAGTQVFGVTTMTIGGANIFGFIGAGGPHWLEDTDGSISYSRDTNGDGWGDGGTCDPDATPVPGEDPCVVKLNTSAIGLALTGLDFGLFVGTKVGATDPAVFVAADINLNSLSLVGVPGVTASGLLAIALNLGFALSASGVSPQGIDFTKSFSYDSNGDGTKDTAGFKLDTGDPLSPMILDFETSFVEVQLAGSIEIRAGPSVTDDKLARLVGIFYLGIDLDSGSEGLRLLALAELTVGPDIDSATPSVLSIGAVGVLILNRQGLAADLQVNLDVGLSVLDLTVRARLILNTTNAEQTLVLPKRLSDYIDGLSAGSFTPDTPAGATAPPTGLGGLATLLRARLVACDPPNADLLCYTISRYAPDILDVPTVNSLLNDPTGPIAYTTSTTYVVVVVSGAFEFVGFATGTGLAGISVSPTLFQMKVDLAFQIGVSGISLDFRATGEMAISHAGLYLFITLSLDADLTSMFSVDVSGTLTIDTRPTVDIFLLDVSGAVNIAKILTINGRLIISVGAEGANTWRIAASGSGSFGPMTVTLKPGSFIQSDGQFSIAVAAGIYLGVSGFSISGNVDASVSLTKSGVPYAYTIGDIYTFHLSVTGGVRLEIAGVGLGATLGVSLTAVFGVNTSVTIHVRGCVELLFWEACAGTNVATISIPLSIFPTPPPNLATLLPGGVLRLNVGADATVGNRTVGVGLTNEAYTVTHVSGNATDGYMVRVEAFGHSEVFRGVKSITGTFGSGNDTLILHGLLVPVTANGGAGNDVFMNQGAGNVTFNGGIGDDTLIGGSGNDILNGDGGSDFLDGRAGADTLDGGADNDILYGIIADFVGDTSISGGSGTDILEVQGTATADTFTLTADGTNLRIAHGTAASFTTSGIEDMLLVPAEGADTVVLVGDLKVTGLLTFKVSLSEQTAALDTVIVRLLDAADDVLTLTGALAQPYTTNRRTDGMMVVTLAPPCPSGENCATTLANVATNTTTWTDYQTTIVSGMDASDVVQVEALGGADQVLVKSLAGKAVVEGGAGADRIAVGSNATTTTNAGGTLEAIDALLTVAGGADADTLTIDDSGQAAGLNGIGQSGAIRNNLVSGFGLSASGIAYSTIEVLQLDLGAGGDTLDVLSTALGTATTADTGAGADTVNVSSDAPTGLGTLHDLGGVLTLRAGVGVDSLFVSDAGDGDGDTGILNPASLTGFGTAGINFAAFEDIRLDLGAGADTLTITDNPPATTVVNAGGGADRVTVTTVTRSSTLTINADGGNDRVVVQHTGAGSDLRVNGNAGADTIDLTGLGGTVTVHGNDGNDDVTVFSTSTGSSTTISGDADHDWIDIVAMSGAVTVNGDAGDDTIEVGSNAAATVRVRDTGGHVDDVDGLLTVRGDTPSASDSLYVDETGEDVLGAGEDGHLTSTRITGLGMAAGITYSTIEHLEIHLGDDATVFNVASTNEGTDTLLKTGGGDDTVNVSSSLLLGDQTPSTTTGTVDLIAGHLNIQGEGDSDIANVSDRGDGSVNAGTLTTTTLTGLDMGPSGITYGGFEFLEIHLGTVRDDFTIVSTHAGRTIVEGHGGDDTVNVRSIAGHTIIRTGAGADLVLVSSLADASNGALSDPDGAVPGGNVHGITAFLDIDAGEAADRLVIDDAGETNPDIGRVTSDEVQGLGMTIGAAQAADAVHVVTVTNAHSGTFTITVGTVTTDAIAFDAKQDVVRDELVEALVDAGIAITAADITVTRSPVLRASGITYRITFGGAFAGAAGRALGIVTVDGGLLGSSTEPGSPTAGVTVATMTTGRIRYVQFEQLDVALGSASDQLALDSTGAATTIDSGAGDDVIDVETIDDATRINGDEGDDTLTVNRQPTALPATGNGIGAVLTLDGGGDSDTVEIQLSSIGTSRIDVLDSGTVGTNRLVIWGSEQADQFLLRRDLVALLNTQNVTTGAYAFAEYVTYDNGIDSLIINMLAGDDHIALDDNSSITTVNGGDGEDTFQVGQLFGDECLGDTFGGTNNCFDGNFIPPALIDSTQGMLSRGISVVATLNGGNHSDLFLVFSNKAVLNANGEDGDDTFVIRTFLEEDSETQVAAGGGADTISYVMNAPVNINGGDGFDTLFIIGTEADDFFVITEAGVYGAGRFVSFVGIERLALDAAEGNDRITVLATAPGLAVEVYGGLGSDTIDVAGDAPVVAADDLLGHSGLVTHSIESGTWASRPIDGVAAEVADDDEPAMVITQRDGDTVVYESGGTDSYTITLTRAPTTDVRITVLSSELTTDQLDARARNVEVSLDGSTWLTAVEIIFTPTNWATPRKVWVRAQYDEAIEGQQTTAIQHAVRGQISGDVVSAANGTGTATLTAENAPFAGMDLRGREVIITSGPGQGEVLTILEHTDSMLTLAGTWATTPTSDSTWQVRGIGGYDELTLNIVNVLVIDDDISEVVIRQTGLRTVVGEDGTIDTWTVGLSATPTADVVVSIAGTDDVCLTAPGDTDTDPCDVELTFTTGAWTPITVTATAIVDGVVESFEYTRLVHTVGGVVVGVVTALVTDVNVSDVLITESDGATQVSEGPVGVAITDTYTIVLTSDPGAETVTITATAIATKTQYDAGASIGSATKCPSAVLVGDRITCNEVQVELSIDNGATWSTSVVLTFTGGTAGNWDVAQTVWVRAINDLVIDGRILQAFPERAQRVHTIQGSLLVDGGVSEFGYPLANWKPTLLPGETSQPNYITPNPAFDVVEDHAVDTLVVNNQDSVAADTMTLTGTSLTGLGMGPSGITYAHLEVLDILLGSGVDTVVVDSTHSGTTTIETRAGNDTVAVRTIVGHTRILTGAGNDTTTVTSVATTPIGSNLLSGIDAQLLVSGGDGDDTTIVIDTADAADDLGTLTQTSLVGLDMVSVTPDNMFSLELSSDLTGVELHVVASRTVTADAPALSINATLTLTAHQLASLTAETLAALLQAALFPAVDNAAPGATLPGDDDRFATTGCGIAGTTGESDSRCANSVFVWASGRLFLIGFRGELIGLDVTFTATPVGTVGTATDLLRTDGITYDTLEKLDIRLGSGDDRFNVRGTLPHTVLTTGAGDDVVYVSDAADLGALPTALLAAGDLEALHEAVLHGTVRYDDLTFNGTLDEVDGKLDIDTGTGSNTLAVSDHASPNADGTTVAPFVVTSSSITGLATGVITYASTGGDLAGQGAWTRLHDAGMFGRGITIHLGTGNDSGMITSVRSGANTDTPLQLTITSVYGNAGNDTLTVKAPGKDSAGADLLARLVVYGDNGNDRIDGTLAGLPLIVFGEDGNDDIQGGTGADVLLGDDGRVVLYRDVTTVGVYDVWLGGTKVTLPASVNPGTATVGTLFAPDAVFETLDVIFTVFVDETDRDDIVRGGAGDDVVIGDVGDDGLDGEAGRDLVVGDRVILTRNAMSASPIVRVLVGARLVEVDPITGMVSLGAVDGTHRADPNGVWPWTITLLDHTATTDADRWGDDVAAGGAGDDVVFGQLGDDLLHGDGVLVTGANGWTIDSAAVPDTALDPETEVEVDTDAETGWETDGDDYVEGNGGDDTIFGGLGQDDLFGGSSDLFGLTTRAQRPDGVDTIFGGNGDAATRNHGGLTGADALRRDADVILGDNGRIFRLVGTGGEVTTVGKFLSFTHDLGCATAECVIPRQVELLDYTPVGERFLLASVGDPANPEWHGSIGLTNLGGGDFLHGEASNDTIWGATGQDAIFGDAGDDDLYGGTNRDWISGGSGSDGIVADHGIILTSRHGSEELLYGVTEETTQNANDEPELATPGDLQTAHINQAGTLHKAVELDFAIVVADGADDGDEPDVLPYTTFWVGDHDIVHGGLGDDFLHGGEGDDMLSGAEALDMYYTGDPWATLRQLYDGDPEATDGIVDSDEGILQHGLAGRSGEFRCYDEFEPLAYVYICDGNAKPTPIDDDNDEGTGDEDYVPTPRVLVPYLTNWALVTETEPVGDGDDVLFGDGGNDWIVGGTDHDRAFGGWGDDLLDMDDDKSTKLGVNDGTDVQTAEPTYADIAYGGAGRDVLIANTGADRLIDWVGEYNSYVVPFSPYGAFAISRSNAPALRQYLLDLAAAEGADITRGGDTSRNGEPAGELGMVTQQDPEWGAQTGAPADPQAGNLQGPRDVLRSEDFTSTDSALSAFAVDSGTWSVVNSRYESKALLEQDALSIFYVDAQLPNYYEITATVSSDKAKGGYKSNAYIVFDYQHATDFRFAGIEIGTGKVQIGHRTAAGWQVLAQGNLTLSSNRNYDLVVVVNGQTVTLYVDGVARLTHTFASPLIDPDRPELGVVDPLTDGLVGVGSYSAIMRVERMGVRTLAPAITFTQSEQFDVAPVGHRVDSGTWTTTGGAHVATATAGAPAITTTTLGIDAAFRLYLEARLSTDGSAGLVYDFYASDRFKYAVLDVAGDRIVLGHRTAAGWFEDATVSVALDPGTVYDLRLVLHGTAVSVLLDGVAVLSHGYHSLLSDGRVGLLAKDGTATVEAFTIATDDPDLAPALPFVSVGDASVVEGDDGTRIVTITITLSYAPTTPVTVSWSTGGGTATAGNDYLAASGTITFAAGQTSATITVDVLGDTEMETDEAFTVTLGTPEGALTGDGTGQVTIRNDDVAVVVDLGATDDAASESGLDPAVFTVTRSGDTSGTLVVVLSWGGTATRGADYTVTATGATLITDRTRLTFAAGATTATLTITPLGDSSAEATETIVLQVVADQHYGIGVGTVQATLVDDTALPTLNIGDAQVVEGDRGGTFVDLVVTLDRASATTVTVEARTYDGTGPTGATAGVDFRAEVYTISFAPGQLTATIRVRVYGDRVREPHETFTIELARPSGAVIADGTGTVTILSDDGGLLTTRTLGTTGGATDTATVQAALAEAIAWWRARGADVSGLADRSIHLVDLPGTTLAIATESGILLDLDAAGHGWGAAGMDLLSVLVHELGHVLGHVHVAVATDEVGHVMQAHLLAGETWTTGWAPVLDAALPALPALRTTTGPTVRTADAAFAPLAAPHAAIARADVEAGPVAARSAAVLTLLDAAADAASDAAAGAATAVSTGVRSDRAVLAAWAALLLLAAGLLLTRQPVAAVSRRRWR